MLVRNSAWVAERDATVVGFMAMDVARGYIDQLFVDVDAQRQGLGSAFIELAMTLSPTGLRLTDRERGEPCLLREAWVPRGRGGEQCVY